MTNEVRIQPAGIAPIDAASAEDVVVSTGQLPLGDHVRRAMHAAYNAYADVATGQNSSVYPALEAVDPSQFGICLVGVDGRRYAVGDADVPFTIMSVSKPYVFALVCEAIGAEEARARIGVNGTGFPFNAVIPLELNAGPRTNPMVNAGALVTTSLIPGATPEAQWQHIHSGLSAFAGRELSVNATVYASASATNQRNRALAHLLHSHGCLATDPEVTVDLYTRQCSLDVTTIDLAMMGATLADAGVQPVTGERVVSAEHCQAVLAVMMTAGLYEMSGDWLYDIGLPGKSGIGGGIVTVAPGKGGMATYSPPLDAAGNSIRGQLATRYLSRHLGLNLFASRASTVPATHVTEPVSEEGGA
ncbi:MAG: glutaminase A [Thermomicrobiales bacterium]|nr:glutaminase A [Thermomicrobiales bacterium]